ncbi:type IV pilus modification PilV family protein [Asaia krungthepensis]|uniref:General secretion pathway protein I n=1 Tax=Asaia krungthepensis NRIC 0535 TaxID=1307925 RepID=A0ABQ0Q236_9PROT|nr:type II secretion system protein [Asaia krungthepensis]GBQ87704.1 general secretion pathway protein I [Asaia krungthepensis NRIC 0535]
MEHAKGAEAGFTLIEVLIAFMIVAFSLAALYRAMLGGIGAGHVANATREAISRAQSHLDAIGHGMKPGAFTQSGEDGSRFKWQVTMAPRESQGGLTLYRVTVTESWPDPMTISGRRSVTLTSLRAAPSEAAP